jgi:hypothetical protein
MFKKNILIFSIFTLVSCNATADQTKINEQNNISNKSYDNRYNIGTITLINTATLAVAYAIGSYIATDVTLSKHAQTNIFQTITHIALFTTTGSVLVEGMNWLDRRHNPPKTNDSDIKFAINKSQ